MAIKTYRPMTQTLRFRTTLVNDDMTTNEAAQAAARTEAAHRRTPQLGRHRPCRFRGGGHKRKLRIIDFKRDKTGIPATVATIEYDPNRSARIALLSYADGEKRYILQPDGLKVGQKIVSGPEADILVGNALPLRNIPPGTHGAQHRAAPGKGAQMVRSAGGSAQLVAKEGDYALVKLPSGETRKVFVGLHGDDRTGRQHRSRERHHRQSRTDALDGKAPAQPRRVDEPGRPSARRR